MTNTGNLGTIEATNPVLTVAPLKEDTEMLRATEKITALYCRLSVEDMKEDKKGGKEDESNSIQNQELICKGGFCHLIHMLTVRPLDEQGNWQTDGKSNIRTRSVERKCICLHPRLRSTAMNEPRNTQKAPSSADRIPLPSVGTAKNSLWSGARRGQT